MTFLSDLKDYEKYTHDSILESKNTWQWQWHKEKVIDLSAKCSVCNTILVYDENKINDTVFYYCPTCNSEQLSIKGGNFEYSQSIIKREIQRKAFPSKYKKVS